MVIQPNMTVSEIYRIWVQTEEVFLRYGLQPSLQGTLKELVPDSLLKELLFDLNQAVGSSGGTCIEGG